MDEAQFRPVTRMAIEARRVVVRKILAYKQNGWVYRVEECWSGASVEAAELARQNTQPQVRVTVELVAEEYSHARTLLAERDPEECGRFAYVLASGLGKVRDLVNNSPRSMERTTFSAPSSG